MSENKLGVLYIVATPIGNLKDISLRGIEILKSVNCIAAEDTRHSQSLLQNFDIRTPIISMHDHNERDRAKMILDRLQQGDSIALISDAGTPLISDPGYFLVREARALGIRVAPIPGACAVVAALSAAGLATDRFIFEGFLPVKTKGRIDRLNELLHESRTVVFYEAPHRILDLLEDMRKVFGDTRRVVIARELTKMFETIHSDFLPGLLDWVKNDSNQQRGEIVVLLEGVTQSVYVSSDILSLLLEHLPLKLAVDLAAKITGERKNELYEQALVIKNNKN